MTFGMFELLGWLVSRKRGKCPRCAHPVTSKQDCCPRCEQLLDWGAKSVRKKRTTTHIRISKKVRRVLELMKGPGDTYDMVIKRIIEVTRK